jgi:hypothetical protein
MVAISRNYRFPRSGPLSITGFPETNGVAQYPVRETGGKLS